MSLRKKIGIIAIIVICLVAIVSMFLLAPIAQDLVYHQFADRRRMLAVPNFGDVVSNLAFLLVGLVGIKKLAANDLTVMDDFKIAYFSLFAGIALVGLGSGYYHLGPDNHTLVWDRLAMTVVIMSLSAIIMAEFICLKAAKILFWPLLVLGASSVIYWIWAENSGQGDLRFYGLVQFLPLAIMPIILICFQSKFSQPNGYWILFLCYLVAKLVEHFDKEIFSATTMLSGHTLKHIFAALGLWMVLKHYRNRSQNS